MSTLLSQDNKRLARTVKAFGCPAIVPLSSAKVESPDQIPYLDLLSKSIRKEAKLLPNAVAEFQGRPVMYFLNAQKSQLDVGELLNLQQRLANRGDHAVLAVVRPGELTIYPLHLDRGQLNEQGVGKVICASDEAAPFLFQSVATGDIDLPGQPKEADPVFAEIQKLLKRAVQDLVIEANLDGLEILSMTGRALFFRFLIDRRIVVEADLEEICPSVSKGDGPHDLQAVFSTEERAAQTSVWLDETFNGDLLPLVRALDESAKPIARRKAYRKAYADAGAKSDNLLFRHLEAILRGWDQLPGGAQLRLPIDWDDLEFRHIPIGVLSQVYEDFSHQVDREDSLDRSVHYTPRALAKLLVDQALGGLESPHEARILDPSCGAGVFLVLALRELVRLRWQYDLRQHGDKARRPGKPIIQSILHRQICGFDVSESALRLAALGLYITVIELNEITRPPSEHHAGKVLHDLVLFNQRTETEAEQSGFVPGSLGDAVDRNRFDGVFDVVVGNPPWTRLSGNAKAKVDEAGTHIARRVLESRGLKRLAATYQNPGGVPDVPFVWRAMEWVRPGGIIAFAMEARLILAQSGAATRARNALLQAVSVTGILNGSDLEETQVWREMKMPWILLWARNEKPESNRHEFQLLTPVRENELAKKGEFRLDYQSAYPVPVSEVIKHGWLCKALAIGTTLDVQVMKKLVAAAKQQSVGSFWKAEGLACGNGFSLKNGTNHPPPWLLGLPVFEPPTDQQMLGGEEEVHTFSTKYPNRKLESPRTERLFRQPLVIIPQAPRAELSASQSFTFYDRDMCFSQSHFGYCGGAHRRGKLAVRVLHILMHSRVFRHFCYMRSPRIGAGRRTILKQDIDAFPFPLLETLSKKDRSTVSKLADTLDAPGPTDWDTVDAFVCRLYRLSKVEQQVVTDTVVFNGPYRSVREPAALPVPPGEANAFAKTLEQALQPFFKVVGQKVRATVVPRIKGRWQQTWRFVTLMMEGDEWTPTRTLVTSLMNEASRSTASRVVMPLPEGGLIVGLIDKRRFWTRSRARLCALHISHEHLDGSFPLPNHQ